MAKETINGQDYDVTRDDKGHIISMVAASSALPVPSPTVPQVVKTFLAADPTKVKLADLVAVVQLVVGQLANSVFRQ